MDKKKPQNTSLGSRLAAAHCLEQITTQHVPMDMFIARDESFQALSDQDKAFCQRLIRVTLRHLGEMEQVYKSYFDKPLPKEKYIVLAHIYLATAQMAYENIPPYAAINSAVEACKRTSKGYVKLVNAMLRRWLREHEGAVAKPIPAANIPKWLYKKWQGNYGSELKAIIESLMIEPPLDLSFKSADARGRFLDAMGDDATGIGRSVRVYKKKAVTELPEYKAGNWWVQDIAASLPVHLLGDIKGKRALDMCAAPGGKAMQMAAMGAQVTALDNQEKRLQVLKENIARVGLDIQAKCADATTYQPDELFDVILLDAPCSATGTLRRNPDVKYIRTAKNLLQSTRTQKRLLDHAITLLKPGGKLIYCVCSMEMEEGENMIQAALDEHKNIALSNDPALLPIDVLDSAGLGFRTHPALLAEEGGMDGFFMARLIKVTQN